MERRDLLEELEQAERQILYGQTRLIYQRKLIDSYQTNGNFAFASEATNLLRQLEKSQARVEGIRDRLRATLGMTVAANPDSEADDSAGRSQQSTRRDVS